MPSTGGLQPFGWVVSPRQAVTHRSAMPAAFVLIGNNAKKASLKRCGRRSSSFLLQLRSRHGIRFPRTEYGARNTLYVAPRVRSRNTQGQSECAFCRMLQRNLLASEASKFPAPHAPFSSPSLGAYGVPAVGPRPTLERCHDPCVRVTSLGRRYRAYGAYGVHGSSSSSSSAP